jgi:murein L,D-transpeptidase YcbB/YkuD
MKMKKALFSLLLIISISFGSFSCKKGNSNTNVVAANTQQDMQDASKIPFDSTLVTTFFEKHPALKNYQSEVEALYHKHQFHYVWYDEKGITELGNLLNSKINTIETEGIKATVPYKAELEAIFQDTTDDSKPNVTNELLLSSLYFFYADKVYHGLDVKTSTELGWYLPRKKQSYVSYLDSLLRKPSLIHKDEKEVLSQYYRLKTVLQTYREIEKKGVWDSIPFDDKTKVLKPKDSSATIAQVRQRLFVLGLLKADSKSAVYDTDLEEGVLQFKKTINAQLNKSISQKTIAALNVPIANRIKTIMVNMERCRWIPSDITKAKEYIVINIPAYRLTYFKDEKVALQSNVVVGKAMNQTVIFSGMMQYIVFSPYWNVPKSIIKKEIAPAMEKNKNYLAEHDMEWNGGEIRQKPGVKNSLGLIKFLFPNSNNIYLHDTPSKGLFNEESRAFSHGCIRVAKPIELANLILKDDKAWTPEKIDIAMHAGKESWYTLQHKIPVYIGYFTAWVDNEGMIHFYEDVYERDGRLAELIYEK